MTIDIKVWKITSTMDLLKFYSLYVYGYDASSQRRLRLMVREAGLIRHRFRKNPHSLSTQLRAIRRFSIFPLWDPFFKKYRFHTSKKPDPSGREAETMKYLCGFDKMFSCRRAPRGARNSTVHKQGNRKWCNTSYSKAKRESMWLR